MAMIGSAYDDTHQMFLAGGGKTVKAFPMPEDNYADSTGDRLRGPLIVDSPEVAQRVVHYPPKPDKQVRKRYRYMECRELETVLPDCDMDEYPEVETQEEVLRHLKMFTASSVLKTLNERNISFEDALRRRQIFTQAMARNQQELAYRQRLIQLHKRYLSGEPDAEQYPSDGDSEQLLDAEVNQFVPSSHSSHFTTSQTYQPTDSGRFTHLNML